MLGETGACVHCHVYQTINYNGLDVSFIEMAGQKNYCPHVIELGRPLAYKLLLDIQSQIFSHPCRMNGAEKFMGSCRCWFFPE